MALGKAIAGDLLTGNHQHARNLCRGQSGIRKLRVRAA
jgi:hypothetical protein